MVNVKVNLSLYLNKHHTMKTYWESGSTASRSDQFTPTE